MLLRRTRYIRLAFQVTLINAITLLLAMSLLIISLNSQYKTQEVNLARKKLSLMWPETLKQDNQAGVRRLRNIYNEDMRLSERPYGIRIASKSNQTLLLEYPNIWLKYGITSQSFTHYMNERPNFRLKSMQGQKEYQSNIDVYTLPLGNYYVQILVSVEERINFLISIGKRSIPIIFGILLISFIIASLALSRVLRPLNNINGVVEKIIEQQYLSQRLTETGKGEFVRLQRNFNIMLDVIERQVNRLRHAAINIGHDIRTPLTRARNKIEGLLEKSPDDIKNDLEESLVLLDDIKHFSKQVLDLSEIESGLVLIPEVPINIKEQIEVVLEIYRFLAEEKNITLKESIEEEIMLAIDTIRLKQLVGNLLDNAIKYTEYGKQVEIKIFEEYDHVYIEVEDEGIGIEQSDLKNIWIASWKKNAGIGDGFSQSTGFGLAIVESIALAYQGTVKVESEVGKGTKIIVGFNKKIKSITKK